MRKLTVTTLISYFVGHFEDGRVQMDTCPGYQSAGGSTVALVSSHEGELDRPRLERECRWLLWLAWHEWTAPGEREWWKLSVALPDGTTWTPSPADVLSVLQEAHEESLKQGQVQEDVAA